MNEKIRTTIYVNKHNWQELGKYIDCKKSEWIDKQIEKRINQHDDVAEIDRQMKELEQNLNLQNQYRKVHLQMNFQIVMNIDFMLV